MDGVATVTNPAWHGLAVEEVRELIMADGAGGLDDGEAARRLAEFGPNEIARTEPPGPVRLFLRQFTDVLAAQLLWINLVTDGLPALALGMDPVPGDVMRRPPARDRNLLGLPHQIRLGWQGAVLAIGPISMFGYGTQVRDLPWEEVRTLAFTCLVLIQLVFAFAVRAQTASMFARGIGANHVLGWAVAGSVALQLLVIYAPLGGAWFGTVPIAAFDWPVLLAACVGPVVAVDLVKTGLRHRYPGRETAFD